MEIIPASGLVRMSASAFLVSSARISSLVRHSCAHSHVRLPLTRLYHSGCFLKYFSGGRSV